MKHIRNSTDIDMTLNHFLAHLYQHPITLQQVQQQRLPIPDLTIEIIIDRNTFSDTKH